MRVIPVLMTRRIFPYFENSFLSTFPVIGSHPVSVTNTVSLTPTDDSPGMKIAGIR